MTKRMRPRVIVREVRKPQQMVPQDRFRDLFIPGENGYQAYLEGYADLGVPGEYDTWPTTKIAALKGRQWANIVALEARQRCASTVRVEPAQSGNGQSWDASLKGLATLFGITPGRTFGPIGRLTPSPFRRAPR